MVFSQSTVCILYSLQSKAIHMGSVLKTTTFSSQPATILVASLILYVDFFDLNRFFYCQLIIFYACSSVYFTFSAIDMPLLLSHDLHVRLLPVVQ